MHPVTASIDTGALLSRSYPLPGGLRVRLRLARRSDRRAIAALLAQRGVPASDLALQRLLRYDPWERISICATAALDGTETVVGVGSIELRFGATPDALVTDDRFGAGLAELLGAALAGRAQTHARRVA